MSKSFFAFLLGLLLTLTSLATQAQTTWISGVTTSTTSTTATLTWTTAVPATTQVQYGLTTSYGSHITLDPALVTTHSASLGGLTAGTVYHLRLLSKDAEPLQLASMDYTITTQAGAVSVTVSPTSGTVASGASQQFAAQVKNATNTQVSWSTSAGSITPGGLFSAPVVTSDGIATIVATSVADPTKSAAAVFTVKAPIQHSVSLNWMSSPSKNVVFYSAYRSSMHGGPYALMASRSRGWRTAICRCKRARRTTTCSLLRMIAERRARTAVKCRQAFRVPDWDWRRCATGLFAGHSPEMPLEESHPGTVS